MILYNIGIYIFSAAVRIASLFKEKARLMVKGRIDLNRRIGELFAGSDIRPIWVHAASLGEFEQGRTVIEAIRESYPERKILLTFFSPSGYEKKKNYEGADYILYLPYDKPRNVRWFLKTVNPSIAVFIKYEFWLNYLNGLSNRSIPTYIVSAVFRQNSIFFKSYGGLFRRGLRAFSHIFVQDSVSKSLLEDIGLRNVTVAGDTRFDRVAQIAMTADKIPELENFTSNYRVIIGGSTWPPDEELLIRLIADREDFKLILAPHEVGEERIRKLVETAGNRTIRFSDLKADQQTNARILVIDTIGILSRAYRYAHFAYVGGGFGVGIHNLLEPAVYGLPLSFGPNYEKFREAHELIGLGIARPVNSYSQLSEWLHEACDDEFSYNSLKQRALIYIKNNVGATEKVMQGIFGE